MTEQTLYPNHAVRMKQSMKTILNRVLKKYHRTFQIFDFYLRGYKRYLLALLIISVLLGLMETFQIALIYSILNASFNLNMGMSFLEPLYIFTRNLLNMPELIAFCLLFILLVILTFFLSLIFRYITLHYIKSLTLDRKEAIFDKLISNDYRYFVDNRRGDIIYTVINTPGLTTSAVYMSAFLCSDIIVVLAIIIMISFVSLSGVVILLVGGLLYFLIVRLIGKRISYSIGKLQLQSSQSENEIINNYIQGVRQIRSVNSDHQWKKNYKDVLDHYWDKYIKYDLSSNLPTMSLQLFFFSSIACAVIFIYYFYQESFLSILPLIGTFVFAALKILPRLSNIGNNNMAIMNSWPAIETMYHFLTDHQYNTIINGERKFETLTSDIIFDDVGFSYNKNREHIKGLHLTIKRKKVTALVGHSGSGKSTVVSLLLRYYDVSTGKILINGINLGEYDMKTILQKMGYVSQDTFLFNATIRQNIVFSGEYSDDQIVMAAKRANIHTFIASLPQGYESIVGDQGIKLSGGEKQRIAIARALVRDPELLVLDEATSNLDNKSEAIVQDAINQASKNITTLIIAHRLSTIRNADTIFVLSDGRIVESGSHNELMAKEGRYFNLYTIEKDCGVVSGS